MAGLEMTDAVVICAGSALLKTRGVAIATLSCHLAPYVTLISENIEKTP